jgi:choline dehydrogenase-like flavoprotein
MKRITILCEKKRKQKMIEDALEMQDNKDLSADLAIIGAGPAGITIARALAGSKISTLVLEAGGMKYSAEAQDMYAGESVGIDYPLTGSRLRYLGGSSNHWGGFCFPLAPIDFEVRDWVPYSGWPIRYEELQPYYDRASEIVEVLPGRFDDVDYWNKKYAESIPALATGRMHLGFVQYSPPTHFGERYRADLENARNIRVLLNANVVNIDVNENGAAVKQLKVRTQSGKSHTVRARYFVLATGGLENPRMLLLSNDVMKSGLGNQNDLVGRFFMEHPHLQGNAEIVAADARRLPRLFHEVITFNGHSAYLAFRPSSEFLRAKKLLNASIQIGFAEEHRRSKPAQYVGPVRAKEQADMLQAAHNFIVDSSDDRRRRDPDYLGFWLGSGAACEQAPNPASRVTLSSERDALGLPRIRLDWKLTEQDRRSIMQHFYSLALEFGALGMGRVLVNMRDDGIWPDMVAGGNHHMGTTRMSDSPANGVVDRNCRVHGIENLYVGGSSVFPTSGIANPTLTIVALALRLAEHIKGRFHEAV